MALDTTSKPMGIKDIRVKRGATEAAFDAAVTLKLTDQVVSGQLKGSGKIVAMNSYIEAAQFEATAGGIPTDALAIMTGMTVPAATGTTPNQKITFTRNAGESFPYFELMGRSLGDAGDDVWIYLPKCKLNAALEATFQDGDTFTTTGFKGMALPDATDRVYDIILNETSDDLEFPA